jgi:Cof subfamily protein (haloacid dehalogenase superfamily)
MAAATPPPASDTSDSTRIRLLLADVDGTLVTPDKELTGRTIEAIQRLKADGILFAVTSGRPPRGMSMLVEPLELTTPISAFNGGVIVDSHMTVLEQKTIPDEVVGPAIELLGHHGLDVWVYCGADWFVRDPKAPHVDREAWTVRFEPTVVTSFDEVSSGVAKLVGVSDDHDKVAAATEDARRQFGSHASAAQSQAYYLDITHPDANKGGVVTYLSARLAIAPSQFATIGDMPNDVLMFAHSGLSIAMGNASTEVQRAARRVTTANDDEGFATAVDRYILDKS